MTLTEFNKKYIKPFIGLNYIFDKEKGYIVWREGTGNNIELLHLRAFKLRNGFGTELVKRMLFQLKKKPPYFSVFGFMLASNKAVINLYKKLGFQTTIVSNLYKGGDAMIFTQSYEVLCQKNKI